MPVRYEGRYPDGDNSLIHKKWNDDTVAATAVTTGYVNGEIARVVTANALQTTTYVDAQDALVAKSAQVIAADANYLESSARNTVVAGLDSSGMLTSSQIPSNLVTERVAVSFTGSLMFSGSVTANTNSLRERPLATATISDPGFPYIPQPFGFVVGRSVSTDVTAPWVGTGVTGLLLVCPPEGSGDTIYGMGACTDSTSYGVYPVFPYAASLATPLNRPAVTGNLTLNLYGSCFEGTNYQFLSSGVYFWVLAVPAL